MLHVLKILHRMMTIDCEAMIAIAVAGRRLAGTEYASAPIAEIDMNRVTASGDIVAHHSPHFRLKAVEHRHIGVDAAVIAARLNQYWSITNSFDPSRHIGADVLPSAKLPVD